jgi:ParB-like chromosome segregation protein Spo0J
MDTAPPTAEKINWALQELPIKSLKDHTKNPRQIGKDQLARLGNLIDKFGLIDKPIVNADMTIIGGHQRVKVLKKQKAKTVQCWQSDRQLTDEEVDELCIGLNLNQGRFDFEILANEWDVLKLLDYGFTEEQLLGTCKEAEEVLAADKQEKKKKEKLCPACGHVF